MKTTTQHGLDFCLWQLQQHISKKDVLSDVVRTKALLAKGAIDAALGRGSIYSRGIAHLLGGMTQGDEEVIDPAVTLQFANWVNAAIRAYDTRPKHSPKQ